MKSFTISILCLFLSAASSWAQQTPAAPQSQAILITGATIHLGNGEVLNNGTITFENGKITQIGNAGQRPSLSPSVRRIDATGKHVYPGFIAPNTSLGLIEIDAVRATNDMREVGTMNPNVRSLIAYNTDSKVTPTVRSNGVLLAQITPRGSRMPGQSSVVQLDAWNWEDAAYATDNAIHLNWPRSFRRTGWWAAPGTISKNDKYDAQVREIETFFAEARAYAAAEDRMPENLKFAATKGLFDGSKKLFIHVQGLKEMMAAIQFAEQEELVPVLVGARDAWRMIDFLKEHQVSIVLNSLHSLPAREDEDVDQPFKTAAALHAAGIPFCFHRTGAWEQRNLPFLAGQAVAYGLPYEAAVAALTGNTAEILGIADRVGTLEKGKSATLFISTGDALDMRTCKVEQAFIDGREIDLNNKQKELDKKFRAKYEAGR